MLHFLPHYPGRDGTSSFCTGLAAALNRVAPESCLVVSARRDERPAPEGVPVVRYPVTRGGPFAVAPEFLRDLRENRHQVDVVMLHGTYNPPMATLGRHLRTFGIPYVFIPHDPYVRELTRHHAIRKAIYWQVFEKPLIEGAVAVQLLDASHEEPLRKRGCRVPVVVVPNGCDPEVLKQPVTSSRIPGKEADIRVLYLGRMDRNHKGLDLLLKGFALVLRDPEESQNGLRLILTGNDWEDRPALEQLAKSLGISDRVDFTGARHESSHQIHSEADLVVLPSRFDGFGLTIIEAMLAARPVLVSSRAGVASHVRAAGGGWVTEPGPASLAAALAVALHQRADWESLGLMNREYVMKHLTWDQVAERTIAEVGRLLAGEGVKQAR